jgi:GAF domain-containing protein
MLMQDSSLSSPEFHRQLDIQQLLIGLASRFINISLDQVNWAVQESLERMGAFVGADRAYIFDFDAERQLAVNTYEWCAEGITPQIEYLQELPIEHLKPWEELHRQGLPFLIEDVSLLPDDGPDGIKTLLASQSIQSLITVPLLNGEELLGAVGFDFVRQVTVIANQEQTILKLFADMLVNVRLRKKADEERREIIELTRHQNARLKKFAGIVAHNIRSHSANIEGLLQVLKEDYPLLETDAIFTMLLGVSSNLNQTLNSLYKGVLSQDNAIGTDE